MLTDDQYRTAYGTHRPPQASLAPRPRAARRRKAAAPAVVDDWREIRLTVPYGPSANRYWRKTRGGRVYVSEEAAAYRQTVGRMAAGCRPFRGEVELRLTLYRPQRSGDAGNRVKVLEDALQGFAFDDDKQVRRLVVDRHDDPANPRVEVVVTPYREVRP